MLVGLLLFALMFYPGAAWLDRDILRESRQDADDKSNSDDK